MPTFLPDTVDTFARRMAKEIDANRHKGNWSAWSPTTEHLGSEIVHHVGKLLRAINDKSPERVSEFAADVANYAMKADQLHGAPFVHEDVVRTSTTGVYRVVPLNGCNHYWEMHFVNTREEAFALMEEAQMHGDPSKKPLGGYVLPYSEEAVKKTGCYGRIVFLGRDLIVLMHECVHAADFTLAHYECNEETCDDWHENLATAASNMFESATRLRNSHL